MFLASIFNLGLGVVTEIVATIAPTRISEGFHLDDVPAKVVHCLLHDGAYWWKVVLGGELSVVVDDKFLAIDVLQSACSRRLFKSRSELTADTCAGNKHAASETLHKW